METENNPKNKKFNYIFPIILIVVLIAYFLLQKKLRAQVSFDNTSISCVSGFHFEKNDFVLPSDSCEALKNFLLGKYDPRKDTSFIAVNSKYTNRPGLYMKKVAYKAYIAMFEAAKKDGIALNIVSATRTFDVQKSIWDAKWTGTRLVDGQNVDTIPNALKRARAVLTYSAMPGTSRHHWGTDVDINNTDTSYFNSEKGKKELKWLQQHAHEFGFYQPYAGAQFKSNGHYEEPWHWSYVALSKKYLRCYRQVIRYQDIYYFEGCETAALLRVIPNYVLFVTEDCQ